MSELGRLSHCGLRHGPCSFQEQVTKIRGAESAHGGICGGGRQVLRSAAEHSGGSSNQSAMNRFEHVGRRELSRGMPRVHRQVICPKLAIVDEEADESEFWCRVIRRTGMQKAAVVAWLEQEAHEFACIFAASVRTARTNLRKRRSATASCAPIAASQASPNLTICESGNLRMVNLSTHNAGRSLDRRGMRVARG
jgi:hypothetical protein